MRSLPRLSRCSSARICASSASGSGRRSSVMVEGHFESRVEREVELQHVDARLAEQSESPAFGVLLDQLLHLRQRQAARLRDARPPGTGAAATLMCGSSPLPDAVTRSTGTGALLPGSAARKRLDAALDRIAQRRVQRALVRAAGGGGVVRHRRRSPTDGPRSTSASVNVLPDQRRADRDLARRDRSGCPRPGAGRRPGRCR